MQLPTRLRILDYLRKYHTATAGGLSRALDMTGANVRHHLAVLETNAVVEVVGLRREGRGRPVQVYALSRHILGDGLDGLSAAMFEETIRTLPPESREAALCAVAARLAGAAASSGETVGPLPRRLASAIARLNELHYQARWEAGASGPRLILGHCPYAAILGRVPELCRLDARLLELLLSSPVRQLTRMEPGGTAMQCIFQV